MDQFVVPHSGSKVTDLNADDLNGLVPSGQSTTNGRSGNLLQCTQLIVFGLTLGFPDEGFSETRETHAGRELDTKHHPRCSHNAPGAPVSTLAYCDSVHTLVDTPNTLSTVDVSEHGPSRWRVDTGHGLLVTRDLSRFHACTETWW